MELCVSRCAPLPRTGQTGIVRRKARGRSTRGSGIERHAPGLALRQLVPAVATPRSDSSPPWGTLGLYRTNRHCQGPAKWMSSRRASCRRAHGDNLGLCRRHLEPQQQSSYRTTVSPHTSLTQVLEQGAFGALGTSTLKPAAELVPDRPALLATMASGVTLRRSFNPAASPSPVAPPPPPAGPRKPTETESACRSDGENILRFAKRDEAMRVWT